MGKHGQGADAGAACARLEDEHEDRSRDGGCRQQPAQGMEHSDRRQWLAPAHRLIDCKPTASRRDEEPATGKDEHDPDDPTQWLAAGVR
jgi:hypothetical protein